MQDGQVVVLDTGRVLSVALAHIRRNFAPFALLALTVAWPTMLMGRYLAAHVATAESSQKASLLLNLPGWLLFTLAIVLVVCFLMFHAVAAAAIAYSISEEMQGRRTGLRDCIANILPRALTVMGVEFGVLLLFALAVLAGAIPGMILIFAGARSFGFALGMIGAFIAGAVVFSTYWVAVPVAIIEGQEPSFCFGRSRKLTAGNRFPIFILILLTEGVYRLVQWLSGKLFGAAGFSEFSWQATVFDMAAAPLFLLWASAASAVAYCHLRILREGWQPNNVTEVFD